MGLNLKSQSFSSFISNSSIKFSFGYISSIVSDSNYYIPAKYIIHFALSKEEKNKVKEFKNTDWINLLNDSTTDWAADLILYDLYKKDASEIYAFGSITRDDWVYFFKKNDIIYWKNFFK